MRLLWMTLLFACAASSTASPAVAPSSTPASPAAACLALATVAHPSQPGQPDKIMVKHVLVKWSGAKNPVAGVTRSREDACLRALAARDALRGGADFDAVVRDYSDEPGAVSRNGSLGTRDRQGLLPAFADAAFELAPGEFSDVVETDFGFHVIARTQ